MLYSKPWKSYEDQLDQLAGRGLLVTDRSLALDYLERVGYYRLSGYWYVFRKPGAPTGCSVTRRTDSTSSIENQLRLDEFKDGATFQNAVDLYVFDKRLRLLVMDALERIEVALRVDVSHTLGRLNSFAYADPSLFHESFSVRCHDGGLTRHQRWMDKHDRLIQRSKEDFVRHHQAKYGLPLAIWVACEIWDFGSVSTLFSGMREPQQDKIASRYGVSNGRIFATWLRSLNFLRNLCAHHSRLWNRNIVDQPRLPNARSLPWVASFQSNERARARCFVLLMMTRQLLEATHPRSTWSARMQAHLHTFPDLTHLNVNLSGSGAPENWESIWQQQM